MSRDELLPLMLGTYPDENPNTVKNWETQLWAFTNRFQVDDIVALPLKTQSAVAFGRITARPYRHVPNAPDAAKHQRPVEWLATDIPRSKIDADLRFSLGGAMTVFEVKRNNAETRIRAMLTGEVPTSASPPVPSDNAATDIENSPIDLATQATDQSYRLPLAVSSSGARPRPPCGRICVLRAQGAATIRISPPGAMVVSTLSPVEDPMGFDARARLCVQPVNAVGDERR